MSNAADATGTRPGPIERTLEIAWGVYAWLTFTVCVSAAALFALIVPGLERRRRWVAAAGRSWFAIARIPVRVRGIEGIPQGHCIVVANHASYMDGVVLQAFLPPRFSFVIKREIEVVPLARFLLRRIGSRFVDRFVASASARAARELLKAAAAGESLAVFPEGTFHPQPGLYRFRRGAFAAAIKGELPIVPVVIRGSRDILPARRILPRPGRLSVEVLPAVGPHDSAFREVRLLARTTRDRMLPVLGEPDLEAPEEPSGLAAR